MNDNFDERLRHLEQRALVAEAMSLYHSQALAVLLALIEYNAETLGPLKMVNKGEIRRYYEKTLNEETEKQLATFADDQPALASVYREVLKSRLD
jgi:hypothetical protein